MVKKHGDKERLYLFIYFISLSFDQPNNKKNTTVLITNNIILFITEKTYNDSSYIQFSD